MFQAMVSSVKALVNPLLLWGRQPAAFDTSLLPVFHLQQIVKQYHQKDSGRDTTFNSKGDKINQEL